MDDDAFWNIQLDNYGHNLEHDKTWLAPPERSEGFNPSKERCEESYSCEKLRIPNTDIEISTRCLQSNEACAYMSHVGEELWDASKLFSSWLLMNDGKQVKGRRVLELGSGCGLLGMLSDALGAQEVVCTDYLLDVLQNLTFNIENYCFNKKKIYSLKSNEIGNITAAYLDWKSMALPDLLDTEWLREESDNIDDDCESTWLQNTSKDVVFQNDIINFQPHVIIGAALVYSPQGISCADTIHHFMTNCGSTDAWILQMTDRPGFDRFLLRLQQLGHKCNLLPISEDHFNNCTTLFGEIGTTRENFKLLHIESAIHKKASPPE